MSLQSLQSSVKPREAAGSGDNSEPLSQCHIVI